MSITTSGRHGTTRAYPSAKQVMRHIGFALLAIAGTAGYVLHAMSKVPF